MTTPSDPLAEIVCVVDRSGSMQALCDDAIGGINAFLAEQKALPGRARLSLVLFDHEHTVVHSRVPIDEARPLTSATYVPRGSTALNDAIGRALAFTARAIGADSPDQRPDRVIVAVMTDGQENASREWSGAAVRELVDARRASGWDVLFLAGGLEAAAEAQRYGIPASDTFAFSPTGAGTAAALGALSAEVGRRRPQRPPEPA